MSNIDIIKQIQGLLGTKVDGAVNIDPPGETMKAFLALAQAANLEIRNSRTIDPKSFSLSLAGEKLVLDQEGFDQPGKWQGGASGVTIGVGYDLGTVTESQFLHDWRGRIPDNDIDRLCETVGISGASAEVACRRVRDITVSHEAALDVFHECTVPDVWSETEKAFPGAETLPADAQGALMSLIYNRGGAMQGDRRSEMRDIRDAIANGTTSINDKLQSIRRSLASMLRLWPKDSGVYNHRLAEIKLVQDTIDKLG